MIIIRIQAGLGNQMFQYALYEKFSVLGKKVLIDVNSYNRSPIHNNYELEEIFHLCPQKAKTNEIEKVKRPVNELSFLERVHRKVKLKLGLPYIHYTEIVPYQYDKRIFNLTSAFEGNGIRGGYYLDGYWQSYRYFEDIKALILNKFSFPELDSSNVSRYKFITNSESVSVHVRRGDFINNPLHNNICTLQYYKKGYEIIKSTLKKPTFFIFSDDFDWCKNNLNFENSYYVNGNDGNDSYKDMQLMSLCKHNIIANSSFSWWGAWLNQNQKKIVIAPDRMINGDYRFDDVFHPEWKLIHV